MKTPLRPWIALVHVVPGKGANALGNGQRGAFANIVALATGEDVYKENVSKELSSLGLMAVEFDDLQTAEAYIAEDRISPELQALLDALSAEYPVQYRNFHSYDEHDS